MKTLKNDQRGQTLIALLIFMLVAMTITLGAIFVGITNVRSNISFTSGEIALQNATSGIENTLMLLSRDPSTHGFDLTFNQGTATITVSGSGTYTIVSVGIDGNFKRTITVNATDTANLLTVNSWSETP